MGRNVNPDHWMDALAELLADTFPLRVLRHVVIEEFTPCVSVRSSGPSSSLRRRP